MTNKLVDQLMRVVMSSAWMKELIDKPCGQSATERQKTREVRNLMDACGVIEGLFFEIGMNLQTDLQCSIFCEAIFRWFCFQLGSKYEKSLLLQMLNESFPDGSPDSALEDRDGCEDEIAFTVLGKHTLN